MSLEHYLAEHLQDLSDKSEREFCFTFSDFLSEEELSEVLQMKKRFGPITVFGGAPGTARNLVRFGSEDSLGYDEDFPVCCLQISPKNERFAEELSHRDVLGALMNLGIERRLLGDIVVRSKTAYLFCTQRIADYLIRNMERIRHTDVRLTVCESLPEGELFTTRRVRITAASLRLDCVLAGVWNKSRSAVDELLRPKKDRGAEHAD